MKLLVNILLLSSFSLLISCSNSEDVVSNSIIQTRKYRKGFHIKKLQKQHRNTIDSPTAFKTKSVSDTEKPSAAQEQKTSSKTTRADQAQSTEKQELVDIIQPKVLSAPMASLERISNHKIFQEDSDYLASRIAGNYLRNLKRELDEPKEHKRYGAMSLAAFFLGAILSIVGIVLLIFGFFEAVLNGSDGVFILLGLLFGIIGSLLTLLSLGLAIAAVVQYAQNKSVKTKRQMIFGLLTLALIFLLIISPYLIPLLGLL